jgi:hypothetical protein
VSGCRLGGRGAPAKTVGSRWSARSRRRGRTTLTPASGGAHWVDDGNVVFVDRLRPVFASGPSRVEVAEVWQVRLPRHLFVPLTGA